VLPGAVWSYAKLPETQRVLLAIADEDAKRSTFILLDANTAEERTRFVFEHGWTGSIAESAGALLFALTDGQTLRLVAADAKGHMETLASVDGSWRLGLFARTAAGWVFALEAPSHPDCALRAVRCKGDVVIMDEHAKVLGRFNGLLDHRNSDARAHAWSSDAGAAFVLGRTQFDVITVDNQGHAAQLQPVRLQFQRETEPLVVDPLHAALPWQIAVEALQGCD
jgi:hypothetical protein